MAPTTTNSVGGSSLTGVTNTTDSSIILKTGERLCHVRHVVPLDSVDTTDVSPAKDTAVPTCGKPFSSHLILYPNACLSKDIHDQLRALNHELDYVFNPCVSKCNSAKGPIEAAVNIGPTLPPAIRPTPTVQHKHPRGAGRQIRRARGRRCVR